MTKLFAKSQKQACR